ncbi:hypothetical protein G7Y89_g1859 [Cudoniella acicularis]|uniref:Uncharacterized protein n=1 Tax=Cudoniella acicularis TaxID=354080 RepID=A0A8H4RUG6_9HELO|nr:hypothetical protein G7Y89_g1859 [Cudoniella acicularis]
MTISEKNEEEPFLAGVESASDEAYNSQKEYSSRINLQKGYFIFLIVQAALLALNVSMLIFNTFHSCEIKVQFAREEVEEPYSPAHAIVQYKIQSLDLTATELSPFFGEPRPELDEAWSGLTESSMVEISAQDMKIMNKSSIAIKETGGYVGYYAVYHQLHCLKRMYQMNYKEYYSDLAGSFTMEHFQHCMEVLRQGLMCKPDLTVNTMQWEPRASLGYVGVTAWDRKCIDWDSFHAWTNTKTIPTPLEDFIVPKKEEGSFGP